MQDGFLVRVLHRVAHRDEQVQALAESELVRVAVLGDRHALDQLHDEVRPAAGRRSGVEHGGDVRVIHQREGLPLGLEPRDDLAAVHPRLDDLERHFTPDRFCLLSLPDDPKAAPAQFLQQPVPANDRGGFLVNQRG